MPSFRNFTRELEEFDKVEGKIPFEAYVENTNFLEGSNEEIIGSFYSKLRVDKILERNREEINQIAQSYVNSF